MLKLLTFGGILASAFLLAIVSGQKNVDNVCKIGKPVEIEFYNDASLLGPGKWSVLNIMKCDKDDMMPIKLDANRRKVDRTHDGFNCNITTDEPIDDGFGVRLDICKVVDGGCKDYSTMADDSMIKFAKKYAEGNVKAAFEAASLDPPDFPVPIGTHSIKNYMFDYDELPPEGPYGEFMACGYLIKNAREVCCAKVHVLFEEVEDEDE